MEPRSAPARALRPRLPTTTSCESGMVQEGLAGTVGSTKWVTPRGIVLGPRVEHIEDLPPEGFESIPVDTYGDGRTTVGGTTDHAWTALNPTPSRSANSKAVRNAALARCRSPSTPRTTGWSVGDRAPAPRDHRTGRMCRDRKRCRPDHHAPGDTSSDPRTTNRA